MKFSQPRRLCFFDCETLPVEKERHPSRARHQLRLGCISKWLLRPAKASGDSKSRIACRDLPYHRSSKRVFHDTGEFLRLLESSTSQRYATWIFAHKASFDCQVSGLFSALKQRRWTLNRKVTETPLDPEADFFAESLKSLFVISDPPTIMDLRSPKGHRVIVVDTLNYWRCSLGELGENVGVQKMPMPAFDAPDSVWTEYCWRDVEIIESAVLQLIAWLERHGFGQLRYTAAGLAAEAYRRAFPESSCYSHGNVETRKLERDGYFGGEVRAFHVGKIRQRVYQYDVNSLYPAMMFRHNLPFALKRVSVSDQWRLGPPPSNPLETMAEVWIRDFGDTYPKRMSEGVSYVRGSFETVLCGAELEGAIRRGDVLGHRRWARYDCKDLFAGFVHKLYLMRVEAKQSGDSLEDTFCKTLLNSLYGRFGMLSTDMIERTDIAAPIDYGTWITVSLTTRKPRRFRVMDSRPFEILDRKEIRGSFPAVSAFITAAGREYMRQLRRVVGRRCLIYQGVDSLIVTDAGKRKLESEGLIDSLALGKLKLQHEADEVDIRGFGDYKIGNKLVTVGRKPDAVDIGNGRYRQTMISQAKEMLFTPPGESVIQQERILTLPRQTAPGNVRDDGSVHPPKLMQQLPDSFLPSYQSVGGLLDFRPD